MSDQPLQSSPMRPVEQIERPRFSVPSGACDAHMHVFGSAERYPSVPVLHYTLPDATLRQYLELRAVLDLSRCVLVQPSFYGTDNRCLLDSLANTGGTARGVVMLDTEATAAEFDRWHAIGVRAVRYDLFKRAREQLSSIRRDLNDLAHLLGPRGWHIQLYTPGWLVRELADFLETLPVDFTVDHMGRLSGTHGGMGEDHGLAENDYLRILGLAQHGRCWIKLTGPYRIGEARDPAAVNRVARQIIAAVPRRVIWGSDWPHIPDSTRDTGKLLNQLFDWESDPAIRHQILVENPARLFGFA